MGTFLQKLFDVIRFIWLLYGQNMSRQAHFDAPLIPQ